MVEGVKSSLAALAAVRSGKGGDLPTTERDLPFDYVVWTSLALALPLAGILYYFIGQSGVFSGGMLWLLVIAGTIFCYVIGFVVATACGYMAGLIGSSNSPISGIGILAVVSAGVLLSALLGARLSDPAVQSQAIALALFEKAVELAVSSPAPSLSRPSCNSSIRLMASPARCRMPGWTRTRRWARRRRR
jgi:putative OPT family oligopeptide transporter